MPKEEGQFKEGNPGKPKGATNKTTRLVKEVFADVFTELQNDKKANLKEWAKENPTEFYKLSSKLIPIQIAGDPDQPLVGVQTEPLSYDELMSVKYGPDWKQKQTYSK